MKNKKSLLIYLLFFLSFACVVLSGAIARSSTNDCNLGDIILIFAVPGFLLFIGGMALVLREFKIKKESKVWVFPIVLLAGFLWLGFERSALVHEVSEFCEEHEE